MVQTLSKTFILDFLGKWQRGNQKKGETNQDKKNGKLDERSGGITPRGW
jgi:hypothetical protein